MKNTHILDVLVVYTENIATSASSPLKGNIMPFSLAHEREQYSAAYAYFLKMCEKNNLSAAFTTSADIIGPGTCSNYWEYRNSKWEKMNEHAFAPLIFDKVSPLRKDSIHSRRVLFAKGIAKPFNDTSLLSLFNDKLKTYTDLSGFTIPSVPITSTTTERAILDIKKLISQHKNKDDFSEELILKDRFGAGGIDIYKINTNPTVQLLKILKQKKDISFILQPFLKFDKGYSYKDLKGFTDIRIIYSQGKIVQRYIRTAKKSDFRCNEHQGGKVKYIDQAAIPKSVIDLSNRLLKTINKKALFALDFIVSNNGNAYFLEGNINPGIYWGKNSAEDKINTKKLINVIIKELRRRTDIIKSLKPKKEFVEKSFIPIFPQAEPVILL
jgi:glutathione synthase/RimK-type ligase-like ATP-grasp enzyme